MLDGRDPAHYLKQLVSNNTPQRLLWLDCSPQSEREMGAWVERWSTGALGSTHWTSRKGERVDKTVPYNSPQGLWYHADKFCLSNRRTVLFAYDLALQLRISQALVWLPFQDWHVDKMVLERTAAWALFRDRERTLLMCDVKSWCPVSLDTLASATGCVPIRPESDKPALSDDELQCLRNVHTVRESMLQVLAWINAEGLGPFRPTGSGQSYAAFRRRFLTHKLLVHDDSERLRAERSAMWTGRCEAWQHGNLTDGPFAEYDLHSAYATIARDCPVPAVARPELDRPTVRTVTETMSTNAVLAHVTVSTRIPVVPTRLGGRTVWPVGEFQTWLWDPELTLALQYADDVTVHRAFPYTREPALNAFAKFVLDGIGVKTTPYGRVPALVMKHWSRCLVGRLGLRFRSWEKFGEQDEPDLRLVTFIDTDEGTSTDMLIAGRDRLILGDMTEAIDSLPQIPSWVMSECRRRLFMLMHWAGDDIVYVDTDSVIVRGNTQGWCDMLSCASNNDWLLIRKGNYQRMTIHGPRNIVAESQRRVAGLPLTARQVAPLEFTGQVMRSVKESMRAGQLDCVAHIPRRFVLDSPDMRRQHLPEHKTTPFVVSLPDRSIGDE